MDDINYDYITEFVRANLPESTGLVREMEEYAAAHSLPISRPESVRFAEILGKLINAENILEVGTAIGYWSIRMAAALGANITTIELSEKLFNKAVEYIERSELHITAINCDGADILPTLTGPYDIIFIDAAKGQYGAYFKECARLVRRGGLIISDNVLYKGMVANSGLVVRRKITIVKRLRAYIKMLKSNPDFDTVILPVGDGMALSVKRVKEINP